LVRICLGDVPVAHGYIFIWPRGDYPDARVSKVERLKQSSKSLILVLLFFEEREPVKHRVVAVRATIEVHDSCAPRSRRLNHCVQELVLMRLATQKIHNADRKRPTARLPFFMEDQYVLEIRAEDELIIKGRVVFVTPAEK
jgi:hypothetical protein